MAPLTVGSELALQERDMVVVDLLGEAKLAGTLEGVTSAVGGVVLLTVTVMAADRVELGPASLATAVSVWVPLLRVVVFQEQE